MTEFKSKVLKIVRRIPRGEVLSYGEVAALAGSPGAARAVGTIMRGNRDQQVPCHRVVSSKFHLQPSIFNAGGYNGGVEQKIALLRSEGVTIKLT